MYVNLHNFYTHTQVKAALPHTAAKHNLTTIHGIKKPPPTEAATTTQSLYLYVNIYIYVCIQNFNIHICMYTEYIYVCIQNQCIYICMYTDYMY